MARRSLVARLALWAAVCALILRAGVPLLAAGAAQLRGVAVAEVCEVYGVALPAASAHEHAGHAHQHAGHSGHGSHSDDAHSGDHCALTALGALAVPDVAVPIQTQTHGGVMVRTAASCSAIHDACATWVARRKQGPPAFA